jgi:hypothetical protein
MQMCRAGIDSRCEGALLYFPAVCGDLVTAVLRTITAQVEPLAATCGDGRTLDRRLRYTPRMSRVLKPYDPPPLVSWCPTAFPCGADRPGKRASMRVFLATGFKPVRAEAHLTHRSLGM